ncbi:MAG: hypothetical protein S4CHLAM123_09230 [Chlamydiales bacterium]|nr:hypothetical protein [Chlamydiales bacterium]
MFKNHSFKLFIFLWLWLPLSAQPLDLSVGGEGALLMNAKTGKILFEKNGYSQAFPASTTKIATALICLQECREDLQSLVKVKQDSVATITPQVKRQSNYRSPAHWLETDGVHIGLKINEEMPFYDLLNALLIASANDAANVLATYVSGTVPLFMDRVNAYLKEIGCKNTHFKNPHGLHHPEHVSTPYDLALMAKEGLKDPIFSKIVSTVRYTAAQTNLEEKRTFIQGNALLKNQAHYSKAIGVKTGYHQAAGKNLVAAAQNGERVLIAVALGYRGDRAELYRDVTRMFETAFAEPLMRRNLLTKGPQDISTKVSGGRGRLKTLLKSDLCYDFYPSEEVPVTVKVNWKHLDLPVLEGTHVGALQIVDENGTLLQQTSLFAAARLNSTLFYKLTHLSEGKHKGRKVVFMLCAGVFMLGLWKLRPRPR